VKNICTIYIYIYEISSFIKSKIVGENVRFHVLDIHKYTHILTSAFKSGVDWSIICSNNDETDKPSSIRELHPAFERRH